MKLKELLPKITVSVPYKMKFTSLNGCEIDLDYVIKNKEDFLERKIGEILFRSGELIISLYPN